jgi:RNA polymerase sigma-70 factor (ECF subfamily)
MLAAAQAGRQWALTLLYRRFNPGLLRYLAARAPERADDLAAETWLGASRRLTSFSGDEESFRAWFFTIAHHRLVEHWRRVKRRRSAPVDPATIVHHAAADDPATEAVDAAVAAAAARRIEELLPPAQAQVVLLRVLGGLDVDQVAAVLGKQPGAVRVLQHKALRSLAGRNFSLEEVTR